VIATDPSDNAANFTIETLNLNSLVHRRRRNCRRELDYSNIDPSRWTYRLPGPTDMQLGVEMEHIERVLAARALSVGVEIQRGCGVDGFDVANDEVTVDAGEQRLRARWLVGCDGGRSTVRKHGGFEFVGTDPEFTGYSVQRSIQRGRDERCRR
jgi:2-polyprenyl-6-methoxyphenol hydroxylase-like FAD-dependent oxidoreductase